MDPRIEVRKVCACYPLGRDAFSRPCLGMNGIRDGYFIDDVPYASPADAQAHLDMLDERAEKQWFEDTHAAHVRELWSWKPVTSHDSRWDLAATVTGNALHRRGVPGPVVVAVLVALFTIVPLAFAAAVLLGLAYLVS